MSISGNVTKPGVYELPVGTNLSELINKAKPQRKIKAVYFGCFGGCMPFSELELTPENVCGKNCAIGSYTFVVIDEKQPILDMAISIAKFYCHESCGKCTPCREGNLRMLNLLKKIKSRKATKQDINTLKDLSRQINDTSLCGLGQTSANHLITACQYFKQEFEAKLR